jgi:hypothetical protein
MFEPPLADEGFAAFNLFARCRVDHVVIVGGDLLVQALRGVGEEIAVLMQVHLCPATRSQTAAIALFEPCAAIGPREGGDEKLGPPRAALDEIVEHRAPGRG